MFKAILAKYGLLAIGVVCAIGTAIVNDKNQTAKINEAVAKLKDTSKN